MAKKKEVTKKVEKPNKKTVEQKSKNNTNIEPLGNKTFLFNVRVIDREKNVLRTYNELTSKEIESLKKELNDGESVKYMLVGAR